MKYKITFKVILASEIPVHNKGYNELPDKDKIPVHAEFLYEAQEKFFISQFTCSEKYYEEKVLERERYLKSYLKKSNYKVVSFETIQ